MSKLLNYILIFIVVVSISLSLSMEKVYSKDDGYKTKTVVIVNKPKVEKADPITTAVGGLLIKEGVGFAINFFKKKLDDYNAKEHSGSYVDLGESKEVEVEVKDKDGNVVKKMITIYDGATIPFDEIDNIRIVRGKAKYETVKIKDANDVEKDVAQLHFDPKKIYFDLSLKVKKHSPYIRLLPQELLFTESAAWGKSKDINIVCSFKFAKTTKKAAKADAGSPDKPKSPDEGKFIMPPVTFKDIKEDQDVDDMELSEAGTEWVASPTVGDIPYTLTVQVVESSTGTGKEVAEIFRKVIDDEDVKKKITAALTKLILPEETESGDK